MRTPPFLLLLCAGALSSVCSAVQNQTCRASAGLTGEQCADLDGPTLSFLTCAGVPAEPSADHILHLKGLMSAALDVYSFMRSSVSGVPVLDLSGGFDLNADHVIRAWLDIKLTPLLSSVSRNFLTCLSNRNLSCSAYQTVVQELSQHFSCLDPVRQKWIYSFFMYPFLSRNTTSGCVDPEDSTEDWLMKNFGSFSVMAQVQDFTSINLLFSGLEVLHLLSPEQKAELLLHPEVSGLTNSSLGLVFQSLQSSLMPSNNGTLMYMSPSSTQDPLGQAMNGFMTAFTPVGSFVKQFVSLTNQQNLSGMRSATLVQALINLTLAEIAAPFKQSSTQQQQGDLVTFDPMNVNDWFDHVVSPILWRFLPQDQTEVHPNLTAVFHNLFYIETGMGIGAQNESQDICSVFIDNRTCGLTDLVEHVATVLHCASSANLTLDEESLLNVLLHLSQNLDALLQQLSMTNFSSQSSPFSDILDQVVDDTVTISNLQDESFVTLWFQIKLKPLLSVLTPEYLTCLSHKEFSCQTFQILVSELSANMLLMSDEGLQNVYHYFILSFLSLRNTSGGCAAENSTIWVTLNLGEFAQFATLREMYELDPDFNAIDALVVLSPSQTAELIVEDFAGLPEKSVIINMVFGYILISPEERGLLEMLDHLIVLAAQMGLECSSYQLIVQRLQESVISPLMTPPVEGHIRQLQQMAPSDCFSTPVKCPVTPYNETQVCSGVNSSAVQQYLNDGNTTDGLCYFSITEYACAPVLNVSAGQLVSILSCPGVSDSPESWKLFLSRVSPQLDAALSTLSSQWAWWASSSSAVLLDVLRELRLDTLTDDGVVALWIEDHLRPLLPFASTAFLQCLSRTNFSCQNFQTVVMTFSEGFLQMNEPQQQVTVTDFIVPFLSRGTPGACVSNDSSQWLISNFGQFSMLVPLDQLIMLNPQFDPLLVLLHLSAEQLVALMFDDLPGLPENAVVINAVFDQLIAPPQNDKIISVLSLLVESSKTGNISCASYQVIFHRLDHLMLIVPALEMQTVKCKSALLQHVPQGCVSSGGQCGVTAVNETAVCQNVNSSALSAYLSSAHDGGGLCAFSIAQYTCAELTDLSALDLATLLSCGLNGSESVSDETWKLFTQKVNPVLGPALDLITGLSKPRPSVSFLNMIGEVTLSSFSSSSLGNDLFVQLWFGSRLQPFLPYASETFLSCLSTRDFSCGTFRSVVRIFSQSFDVMSSATQANVYIDFIKAFLSRNDTAGCVGVSQSSSDWLIGSFGRFSIFTTASELQTLNPSFSVLDVLGLLSVGQLVEVSSAPGFLSSAADVNNLLLYVTDAQFTAFYTSLSGALQVQGVALPPPVQDAFLQQVFVRANLTSMSDDDLSYWILSILPSFIANISAQHVTSYFSVIQQRPCAISQQAVVLLNSSSSSFQPAAQQQIYQQILGSLAGPTPLRCYANQSYYAFLSSSFMSFQFPNLTTFLSLIPAGLAPQLMGSISPAEVSSLLNRPNAVDDLSKICQFFTNYPKTPQYLQTEALLPVAVSRQVLSCVWPQVLKVEDPAELDQWFGSRLVRYLPLLTADLVAPDVLQSSSCLAFSKFVSVMAKYNYSAVGFSQSDIYSTILAYANTSSGSTPKCYNTSDPSLNSTAWFVNYVSVFLSFVTVEDLLLFGSIEPFLENQQNLQLFAQTDVDADVMDYYVTLLFDTDPSFSAYYLPLKFLCLAPASSFAQLSPDQMISVSTSLNNCSDMQPDVSAALASSVQQLSVETLSALGQSCSGLSTAQISGAGGRVLLSTLSMLSLVLNWNLDQAMMIIQTLLTSGVYQINSVVSLQNLGSLIIGVQSSTIELVSGGVLLQALQSQAFVSSISGAPVILQQTAVNQIITVNSSSDAIITNIPDVMATQIPRNFLLGVSSSPAAAETLNRKTWKHEQAVLLFESVATQFSDPSAMSFQVLQGFTCSRVQSFSFSKIMGLIRGCRRRANQTLVLQESQLTGMYFYIKSSDVNAFSQYPAEVLIYYNYSLINRSLCSSYFSNLGTANFSVLSSSLSFKKQTLLSNAIDCLGISGFNISQAQLDVLGNMCCFLSADYIQSSDPHVLEKLKQCSDLSSTQISAAEGLLLSGNSSYGSSGTWNITTLQNLGMLPLYLSANIWSKFAQADKQKFLKTFIRDLRKNNNAPEMKILTMMNQVTKVSRVRIRRDAGCTAGPITQAQVYSDMFPFAYDVTQFNACLSVQTLKDNLQTVTERVYDSSYQRILLDKLRQGYPSGLPDEVLQVLGSASRAAAADDVTQWNLTKIDTLTALMNPAYGDWDPNMVQLMVGKYLSVNGNTLGTNELNALGANLCALNTSVLNTITAASLQRASALSLTNCSSEKKTLLFAVAQSAFSTANTRSTNSTNSVSVATYQLLQAYIGGADTAFVRTLVNSSVNMDVPTFMTLQQSVINVLNVSEVRSLLGVNVGDLKTYESASQIQQWIRLQPQVALDSLQIGLTGGTNSTSSTSSTSSTTASTASSASTASTASSTSSSSSSTKAPAATAATTGAGSRLWSPDCLQLLLFAVAMMTLQLLH